MDDRTETLIENAALVRRMARDLTGDAEAGDDAAQDALLAALENPPRERNSLRAWFATVLRRGLVRRRGEDTRRIRRERRSAGIEAHADPAAIAAERDLVKRVIDAVYDLEEPYRRTLLLRYLEDREIDDVARELSVPRETVRTRIKRGLERVRARLDREHPSRAAWLVPLGRLAVPVAVGVVGIGIGLRTVVAAAAVIVALFGAATLHERSARRHDFVAAAPALDAPKIAAANVADAGIQRDEIAANKTDAIALDPLAGRVVDAGKNPIANATLRVLVADLADAAAATAAPIAKATSDDSGRFSIAGVAGQDYLLAIEAKGFSARAVPVTGNADIGDVALRKSFAIFGVVRDLEKRPVAGASVKFRTVQGVLYRELETTSGSDGAYRIDDASNPGRDETRDDSWSSTSSSQLFVEHSDYAPLELNYSTLFGFDPSGDLPLDLFVTRGGTLEGRAFDAETGLGLADVAVTLRSIGAANLSSGRTQLKYPFWNAALASTRSDGDGTFTLARVPAWGVQEIGMHSVGEGQRFLGTVEGEFPGYLRIKPTEWSWYAMVPDEGATVHYDVAMLPCGTLRGRVVDEKGAPVVGADVAVSLEPIRSSDGEELAPYRSVGATTDATGAFEFAAPLLRNIDSKGELRIWNPSVRALKQAIEGLRAQTSRDLGSIVASSPDSLPAMARFEITRADDQPISRARVEVIAVDNDKNFQGPDAASLTTDRNGTATMTTMREDLSEPLLRARVIASGFETTYSATFKADVAKPPTIRIQSKHLQDLGLEPEPKKEIPPAHVGTIDVTVLDASTRKPIVRVLTYSMIGDGHGHGHDGREIEPGVFRISKVPLGEWFLQVRVTGYAAHPKQSILLDTDGATIPVTIALERGTSLRAHVVASDGSKLEGFGVWLWALGPGRSQTLKLDADQRFEASGFKAGESYEVTIARGDAKGWFTPPSKAPLVVPATIDTEIELRVVPSGYAYVRSKDPRLGLGTPSMATGDDSAVKELDAKSFFVVKDSSGGEIHRRRMFPCGGFELMFPFGTYVFRLEVFGDAPKEQTVVIDKADRTDVTFDEK